MLRISVEEWYNGVSVLHLELAGILIPGCLLLFVGKVY